MTAGTDAQTVPDTRQKKRPLVETLLAERGDVAATRMRLAQAVSRADECEPWLKAFVFRAPADSLPDSDAALSRLAGLPLCGVPFGIKDLMATADMPTTYGSAIYASHRPSADAWIVAKIREYGGVVFGKTVTTEFAWREPGPTTNPWNRLHTPGGSSSGSAAAVGAGIVPLATGTQTVGSVIRPGAFCGAVAYKPSYGRIPTTGIHPLAESLDHVGFFAQTVPDIGMLHALFVDGQPAAIASAQAWQDYFAKGTQRMPKKLAVVRTPLWDRVSDVQKASFDKALKAFSAAGVVLIEKDFAAMPGILQAIQTVLSVEASRAIGPAASANPTLISQTMLSMTEQGATIPAADYQAALQLRTTLRAGFHDYLDGCEAILTVPATGEAPEGLSFTGDTSFCAAWSFLGVPAVTVPAGFSPAGLPLGLQIVGDIGADLATLQTAAWIEQTLP